jgi:energy-coupling factor transporter ATP-binding protein EcfA2
MHDIVVARLEGMDTETLSLAEGLDFTEGVLRSDSTWVALRQGGRYLTPFDVPDVDDSAHSFHASVQLEGMKGVHEVDADFGDDFPLSRRSLVLVGENGVGKTRLLQSVIAALQTSPSWDTSAAPPANVFSPRPTFSRLLMFSSTSSDQYPSDVMPWRGLDYRFHRMIGHAPESDDDLAESLIDSTRSDGSIATQSRPTGARLLDQVLETLGIDKSLHVEVRAVDEEDALPTPTQVGNRLYLPFFEFKGEEKRLQLQSRMIGASPPRILLGGGRVRALSSGEQALLRFATQAIGSLRPGSLFLFDEPETHLHPRYVSFFMSILDQLLEASGSIAVIATHSAYIVREVPARRVRIIKKEADGELVIVQPRLQTFGASIDAISQFVFGDIEPKHGFQTALDRWITSNPDATVQTFKDVFRDDLSAEVLSYVAQKQADRDQ